jgi:lysophospholipase L1-like esterase
MNDYQILCFGDSNTWGYVPVIAGRYPRAVRWTGVMDECLGRGYHVVEEGQSGRTTVWDDPVEGDKSGLRYLPACLESHKPLDLVILMLGTNDLKARFPLPASDIALGAERLAQVILTSACGIGGRPPSILLAAPPPIALDEADDMFQGGKQKSASLARRYAEVADRAGCAFLDVGSIIAVDAGDGIHYSAKAHQRLGLAMAERVLSIRADQSSPE